MLSLLLLLSILFLLLLAALSFEAPAAVAAYITGCQKLLILLLATLGTSPISQGHQEGKGVYSCSMRTVESLKDLPAGLCLRLCMGAAVLRCTSRCRCRNRARPSPEETRLVGVVDVRVCVSNICHQQLDSMMSTSQRAKSETSRMSERLLRTSGRTMPMQVIYRDELSGLILGPKSGSIKRS